MDVVQRQTTARHTPRRHGAVNAAGKQVQRASAGTHGQAARRLDLGTVDIGGTVADLDHDLQLRLVDVHAQVVVLVQQVSTQLAANFGAFHRIVFVGALGFDLEGAHAGQLFAQIGFGGFADGVKVLGTLDGAAHLNDAEHAGNAAERLVHIQPVLLRLDKDGALRGIHAEFAQRLQPPADDFDQPGFKLAAVQTLQGNFALIRHKNFFHIQKCLSYCLRFVKCAAARADRRASRPKAPVRPRVCCRRKR